MPGAGHAMLGKVWPAAFIAAAVLALYVGGMALAGWTNVDPVKHRWYFVTHVFAGGPTLAAWLATRGRELTEFRPHLSAGELFTALAGLLNLIAVCDVWTRATRGDPSPEPAEEATGA
ncbi:MAG: hypothetical protein HMLKMBBP_03418 [Planctomycetes bacterium]|nr:hypothetical protein [Planctomycetota bacterium]